MPADYEELTFDFVDDVCLALQDKLVDIAIVPSALALRMGPLIELHHLSPKINTINELTLNIPESLQSLLRSIKRFNTDIDHSNLTGFVRTQDLTDDDLLWTNFTIRAKRAAASVGFSSEIGGKIVAAITEMHSNIVEHSERSDTGYIVYSASEKCFEFLVADNGIGVLKSLKSKGKFLSLNNYGEALELAVSENVSRFEENDRGFGFRPIFVGLANMSDLVRFRSGDYAYIWEKGLDGSIGTKTIQLANMGGLLCYVRCSLP